MFVRLFLCKVYRRFRFCPYFMVIRNIFMDIVISLPVGVTIFKKKHKIITALSSCRRRRRLQQFLKMSNFTQSINQSTNQLIFHLRQNYIIS